jgi:hypothetical protein
VCLRETLLPVTARTTRPKLLAGLEQLTRKRFPEGLARRVERSFRATGVDADAAVGDAIAIMVKKADTLEVEDARRDLAAIATNLLRRSAKNEATLSLGERDSVAAERTEDESAPHGAL